jgi:hypothetical protein
MINVCNGVFSCAAVALCDIVRTWVVEMAFSHMACICTICHLRTCEYLHEGVTDFMVVLTEFPTRDQVLVDIVWCDSSGLLILLLIIARLYLVQIEHAWHLDCWRKLGAAQAVSHGLLR